VRVRARRAIATVVARPGRWIAMPAIVSITARPTGAASLASPGRPQRTRAALPIKSDAAITIAADA
jgi:hypothetical protein